MQHDEEKKNPLEGIQDGLQNPIMKFHIEANAEDVTDMSSPYGAVTIIPFWGWVESELFTGKILPGAADVQVENPAGSRNMCAKYIFRGKDVAGKECYLFVENNGYFDLRDKGSKVLNAWPRFITDSEALGPYLCQNRFRSEVRGEEGGLEIWIYDVCI